MSNLIMTLDDGTVVKALPGKVCFLKDGIVFKSILPGREKDYTKLIEELYSLCCECPAIRENCRKVLEICTQLPYQELVDKFLCALDSGDQSVSSKTVSSITDANGSGYYLMDLNGMVGIHTDNTVYVTCYTSTEEIPSRLLFILMHIGFFFGQPSPSNWVIRENGTGASICTLERLYRFCATYSW